MRIGVTGSTGLVGSALCDLLKEKGHEVVPIVRRNASAGQILWAPAKGELNAADLAGLDGVVHLAGENIAGGRWNAARKKKIVDSRVDGTTLLSQKMAEADPKPKFLVCASAIGFYGERGPEPVNEEDAVGTGFLADTCKQWEDACQPARDANMRVVNVRIGIVLSPKGGALQKMLTPFKLGGGGIVGNGRQFWSWVALDDVTGAIVHAVENEDLSGPLNAVSPEAVDNRKFTKVLGKVLRRPTLFPLPAFVARIVLGEMADELLLSSIHVKPKVLSDSGYKFQHPDLESALRHLLA